MPRYTVDYKLVLWGSLEVEAASEEEIDDALLQLPNAALLECADLGSANDIEITNIECETPPLEQLAETAE